MTDAIVDWAFAGGIAFCLIFGAVYVYIGYIK